MADPTNEEPTFSSIKQVVEDKIDAYVNKKFRELNYDAR